MGRTITVSGHAEVHAPSDITFIIVDVKGVRTSYDEAVEMITSSSGKVKEVVEKLGFERAQVKSTVFEVKQHKKKVTVENGNDGFDDWSYSGEEKYKWVLDGFTYETRMEMEFPNNNETLGRIINGILELGIMASIDFGFKCSNYEVAKRKAMVEAVKNAKSEAEAILEAAGAKLGLLLNTERRCSDSHFPPYGGVLARFNENLCCSSIDVEPKDVRIEDTVTLTWEIVD